MNTIGIVCEGERDFDMLTRTIQHFMDLDIVFLWLQPNPEFGTQFGNGWKGVWRWCETHSMHLHEYLTEVTPTIDLLVIQVDADVARCEKDAYCTSVDIHCPGQGQEPPLNCSIAKDKACKQELPPNPVCDGTVSGRVAFLERILSSLLDSSKSAPVIITIPCDSSDTWILAAYESKRVDLEMIDDPWDIITHKKDYHGVRIPSRKKNKKSYASLINHVCENWVNVKSKCPQALRLEQDIRSILK